MCEICNSETRQSNEGTGKKVRDIHKIEMIEFCFVKFHCNLIDDIQKIKRKFSRNWINRIRCIWQTDRDIE